VAGWFIVVYGYFSKAAFGLDGDVLSFSSFILFSSCPSLSFVVAHGLSEQAG
jgi:hypothetical protein